MNTQVVVVKVSNPVVVERNSTTANVVVATPQVATSVAEHPHAYHLPVCDARVVEVLTEGPQGPVGPPGETEGATKNLVAGETIFGHRVVRVNGSAIYHPNISIDTHADQVVGIATQSGSTGNLVSVRTKGTLTEPSWTWAPGFVWCGSSGALTQSPSATGWLMVVGRVLSPTSIDVDIEPAIHRIGATAPDYFPAENGPSYFPGGW